MAFLSIQPVVVEYNLTILNNVWSVFLRALLNMLLACININIYSTYDYAIGRYVV